MKKKGFTLIELLAVIVILAVISLIATPMILNVIETARKGSAEASALGYLDAVEKQIMLNQLDSSATQITDGIYDLPMNGISVKGEEPAEGWIVIENNQVANYSMKMMDYIVTKDKDITTEGEVADKPQGGNTPEVSYICKRATELHTEGCQQTDASSCYSAGYVSGSEKGTTITYGNLGTMGKELQSGDALDCDVDGTGYNHRFYYVTDLESNSDYAVLIYYNNTSNSMIAYDTNKKNWYGPTEAIKNLPTVNDWNKISLTNIERAILTETSINATTGGSLPTDFRYEREVNGEMIPLAARLLTYQEVVAACGVGDATTKRYLNNCNYLMENTKYSSASVGTYGYWLETPNASFSSSAWGIYSHLSNVNSAVVYSAGYYGFRPVIEVPKSKILY